MFFSNFSGRSYLCSYPAGVRQLLRVLLQLDDETDRITKEHLLGCLQKLSLRRSLQTIMIEGKIHPEEQHYLKSPVFCHKVDVSQTFNSLLQIVLTGDMVAWLVRILLDFQSLSDYMLEYAIALLMNLCLRSSGKRKCAEISEDALNVC